MNTQFWNQRFAGQVAAVTGGADGLGFAIARRLRAEGARGASVCSPKASFNTGFTFDLTGGRAVY